MNTIIPSQFFFGSKEDIDPIHSKDSIWNRMFQEGDVQELTRLRQECKIGSIISWIELFGLRLSEVLNQCTDNSDTIEAWHAHYLIVKIYVWNQEPLYPEWYQQMRAIDSALKTSSLATQWEKTHKLFLKFLMIEQGQMLLQPVDPMSEAVPHRQQAAEGLVSYLNMNIIALQTAQDSGLTELTFPLDDLQASLKPLLQAEDLMEAAQPFFAQWGDLQVSLIESIHARANDPMIELMIDSMLNCRAIVEECIIQTPEVHSCAHINRILQITKIIRSFDPPSADCSLPSGIIELRTQLQTLIAEWSESDTIARLLDLSHFSYCNLLTFSNAQARMAYQSLSLIVEHALEQATAKPKAPWQNPSNEKEVAFWRYVFVFIHDLRYLTQSNKEPLDESTMFPEAFLALLIPEPIKQPPAPKPKPIAEKEPVIDVIPEDILLKSNRKHRHVIDILKQLGLKPLPRKHRGKGDHEIWRDPSGRFGQAVVPDHKEIAEGTRRSIVKQLKTSSTDF